MGIDPKDLVFGPDSVIVDDDVDLDEEPITLPDGRVIDNAGAEKLVEETYEELRRRNLIPGRKSLSGGSKHSPRVQFRVPDDIREKAERRAREKGVTLSVLAREALEQYLAS
jgi:predicted HicB family RNase H-like nuclease